LLHEENFSTLDILRRLVDTVRRKDFVSGELTFDFSFTVMLQRTGRFWSRVSEQRTI